MSKTVARLADGRQLVYFDSVPQTGRDAADTRLLPLARPRSELRFDPVTRTWVMYARHRQERTYLPGPADCPLCPTRDGRPTEIPAADYEVVVFENRYPALTGPVPDGPDPAADLTRPSAVLRARPPAGRCEVICFTGDHNSSFADLPPAHPHGQIYAYPFVTPRTARMLRAAQAHARRTGRNLFDDVLAAERADGSRVVFAGRHWTAFVPHAARWPYEVHCYPRRRVPDLASLLADERRELAEVQLDLLGRFARLFAEPAPHIAGWHQAPVRADRALFALHLEIFTVRRSSDKLKYLAGSESGMDAFANDVIPEQAAEQLRKLA